MIITVQKDVNDIVKNLRVEKKVFIMGCGECATACKTGGDTEVRRMEEYLKSQGFTVTGITVPEAPCITGKTKISIAKNKKAIDNAESVLCLTCGLGAQALKNLLPEEKNIHIGCDTVFAGQINRPGEFFESCSACGECMLEFTDALCPVTRCPKGLLNGPCGGQNKGKCEVDDNIDCVWILIYEALKKKKKLFLLKSIKSPKSHKKNLKPRSITLNKR